MNRPSFGTFFFSLLFVGPISGHGREVGRLGEGEVRWEDALRSNAVLHTVLLPAIKKKNSRFERLGSTADMMGAADRLTAWQLACRRRVSWLQCCALF